MLGTMFHSNHKREFVVIGLARDEVKGQIAKAPTKRSVFSKKAFTGEMEEKIKSFFRLICETEEFDVAFRRTLAYRNERNEICRQNQNAGLHQSHH